MRWDKMGLVAIVLVSVGLFGMASTANAAMIVFDTQNWNTTDDYGIYENATNQYRSNGLGSDNILWDQVGPDSSEAIRIRSSTGSLVLKDPLPLATLNAESVTITYDIKEHTAGYLSVVQYSADGQFQFDGDGDDTVTLATYTGAGTLDTWVTGVSHTISDPAAMTDTFQLRFGKPSSGQGSNSTYHAWDNFVISYVVPEPHSLVLLSAAMMGLAMIRRRK
jgi:hypothetical protein